MLNLTKPRYVMPVPRRPPAAAPARASSPSRSASTRSGSSRAATALALEIDADRARLGEVTRRRDDLRRRRRHRRPRRRRPARPPHAVRRRGVHRRGHGLLRRRHAGRAAGDHLPRRPVPRGREADGLVDELRDVGRGLARRRRRRGRAEPVLLQQDLHDDIAAFVYDRLRRRPDGPAGGRRGLSRASASAPPAGSAGGVSGCSGGRARSERRACAAAARPPEAPVGAARPRRRRTAARPDGGSDPPLQRNATGGLPVFDAEAVVADPGRRGPEPGRRRDRAGLSAAPASAPRSPEPTAIRAAIAAAQGRAAAGPPRGRGSGIDPGTGSGSPGRSRCRPPAPLGDFEVLVDALRRDDLPSRDLLGSATGPAALFDPNPVVSQGVLRRPCATRSDRDSSAADRAARARVSCPGSRARRAAWRCVRRRPTRQAARKRVCRPSLDWTGVEPLRRPLRGADGLLPRRPHARYIQSLGFSPARCEERHRGCGRTGSATTTPSTRRSPTR